MTHTFTKGIPFPCHAVTGRGLKLPDVLPQAQVHDLLAESKHRSKRYDCLEMSCSATNYYSLAPGTTISMMPLQGFQQIRQHIKTTHYNSPINVCNNLHKAP
jgi:hypothetical protein